MPRLAFIDHYDSFSFNVLDCFMRSGVEKSEIMHIFHDDFERLQVLKQQPLPLVMGPGPFTPKDVPQSLQLTRLYIEKKLPFLGICLGHQVLGAALGLEIVRGQDPWHGLPIELDIQLDSPMFEGCSNRPLMACYNSLVLATANFSPSLEITALNSKKEVMAMRLKEAARPVWSVQFHPESFMSAEGPIIIENWLRACKGIR